MLLQPKRVRPRKSLNRHHLIPIGSHTYHRVIAIDVNVYHRRKIYMHAEPTHLHGQIHAQTVRVAWFSGRSVRHGPRILYRIFKTHSEPPLRIHSHEERNFRDSLQAINQPRLPRGCPLKKYHPPDAVALHLLSQPFFVGNILIGVSRKNERLRDPFAQG